MHLIKGYIRYNRDRNIIERRMKEKAGMQTKKR